MVREWADSGTKLIDNSIIANLWFQIFRHYILRGNVCLCSFAGCKAIFNDYLISFTKVVAAS